MFGGNMASAKTNLTPKWVKGFDIAAGIVAVLVVILILSGHQGFSRHFKQQSPATIAPAPAPPSQP